ncbi:MAG: PH domain-containing protein [Candidatus Aenigmatarchaeota archaeon]
MVEKTYVRFHPTRLAYIQWYLLAFIFIGLGIFVILAAYDMLPIILSIPNEYAIYSFFIPVLGTFFIIIADLLRRDDTYTVTNYRIIEKRGIFNIKEDSVNWDKVSNYTLTQNIIDRLFSIGTIRLYSVGGADAIDAEVTIKKAPNIHKIKALLDKLIERKGPVV